MNLKVVEWNVNGHKGKTGRVCTKKFYESILSEVTRPDVIVLTEYKEELNQGKDFEQNLSNDYFFNSYNDILIALNKNKWKKLEEVKHCSFEELHPELEYKKYPEICVVKGILQNNTPVIIIGIRIKVSNESYSKLSIEEKEEDYKNRLNQLDLVFEIIDEKILQNMNGVEGIPIILTGDFNNSRYLGDMNDLGKMVQKEYEGKLTKCYNLQLIKKAFLDHGYEYALSTPLGNSNSVYSHMLRVPCKLDHIFVKNLKVTSVKYSTEKYQSDHRMLIADVESVK